MLCGDAHAPAPRAAYANSRSILIGVAGHGVGSLLHHGGQFYELRYDRCDHTATVISSRRELEQIVKAHYATCQQCARPLKWVCPGCALVLSSSTISTKEDLATGRIVARCSSCSANAWG